MNDWMNEWKNEMLDGLFIISMETEAQTMEKKTNNHISLSWQNLKI